MPKSPISKRSLEDLESELVSYAGRMNMLEYEFLSVALEYDLRQGWKAWGFNNCAEWLNMKCGIHVATAREKLRVIKALFDLPLASEAFASGQLSYSKARSLTRVANIGNEEELLDYAINATASQVDEYCLQRRNANRAVSIKDVKRIHKARYLSCQHHSDGASTISVELPRESADLLMKAIEIAAARDAAEVKDAVKEDDSYFAKQADALLTIVQDFLVGGSHKPTGTADHYQVIVHVDQQVLLGNDESGKSDLPVESVRRLTCDTGIVEVTEDDVGEPLNVGRKHRVVSPMLKRALLSRDRCCRFPGCTHDKWLDAHHVVHWINGGETSAGNTLLLCSKHHHLLHEGGYTIQKNRPDAARAAAARRAARGRDGRHLKRKPRSP